MLHVWCFGGMNTLLAIEKNPVIPLVSKAPTIILRMDVSHGSPGQFDVPSIVAIIMSRDNSFFFVYCFFVLSEW